ncbi:hypothetical protein [Paenibacillus ihumii]|uniref:hypothetical protein n=1 Tax=Paenibacillus ihumii TaxID=687436 RepID=UPI0006D7F081|nr:hypothetical protein [Paenibacillus ihumii]
MDKSKRDAKPGDPSGRDHPEQYPTSHSSLFDMHESEMHVDPIPVEDLKLEVQEERNKEATKHRSSSEGKYHTGFEDDE